MNNENSWGKYAVNLVVFGLMNLVVGTIALIVLDELDVLIPLAIAGSTLLLLGVNVGVCLYDSKKLRRFANIFAHVARCFSFVKKIIPGRRVVHSFTSE